MKTDTPTIQDLLKQMYGCLQQVAPMMIEMIEGHDFDDATMPTPKGAEPMSDANALIALSAETKAVIDREQAEHRAQSHQNVCKWGLQNAETLILAINEQTGKMSQSFLHSEFEPEKYTPGQLLEQARHTAALCLQLAVFLEYYAQD